MYRCVQHIRTFLSLMRLCMPESWLFSSLYLLLNLPNTPNSSSLSSSNSCTFDSSVPKNACQLRNDGCWCHVRTLRITPRYHFLVSSWTACVQLVVYVHLQSSLLVAALLILALVCCKLPSYSVAEICDLSHTATNNSWTSGADRYLCLFLY